LIAEVLAACFGGIEVALNGHANAAADDAVPVAAAQGGLHARDALVRHALEQTDVEAQLIPLDGGADDAHKGERHAGLPVLGRLRAKVKTAGEWTLATAVVVWNVTQQRDMWGGAYLEDEVVQRLTDLRVLAVECIREVVCAWC
jgi:hypothetical protein